MTGEDKDPYPDAINDTTCGWPDEPDHDDVVIGGQSGKDPYPEELCNDDEE